LLMRLFHPCLSHRLCCLIDLLNHCISVGLFVLNPLRALTVRLTERRPGTRKRGLGNSVLPQRLEALSLDAFNVLCDSLVKVFQVLKPYCIYLNLSLQVLKLIPNAILLDLGEPDHMFRLTYLPL
jgi:hypothetical protein